MRAANPARDDVIAEREVCYTLEVPERDVKPTESSMYLLLDYPQVPGLLIQVIAIRPADEERTIWEEDVPNPTVRYTFPKAWKGELVSLKEAHVGDEEVPVVTYEMEEYGNKYDETTERWMESDILAHRIPKEVYNVIKKNPRTHVEFYSNNVYEHEHNNRYTFPKDPYYFPGGGFVNA